MKNIQTFDSFINESKVNEAFVSPTAMATLDSTFSDYEGGAEDDDSINIPIMKKGYEIIAKLLKGNMKTVVSEMEEGEYELCKALAIGLDKRATGYNNFPVDPNIQIAGEANINSAFDSSNSKRRVVLYHIKDANIDVAVWVDGDDYAEFDHIACLKKDEKKLVAWVNKNLSEDDMGY
jgi:hypothetical protein